MKTKNRSNENRLKARHFFGAYADVMVAILAVVAILLLNYLILPFADTVIERTLRSPHDVLLAYTSGSVNTITDYSAERVLGKMEELSVESIKDIEELQDAEFLSGVCYVSGRVEYTFRPSNLTDHRMEYVRRISDRLFTAVYATENEIGERTYLCLFFEYDTYGNIKNTGVTLWVPHHLVSSSAVSEEYSDNKWKGSYIGESFGGVFGYPYIAPDKDTYDSYLSTFYKQINNHTKDYKYGKEYYLTSNGIAEFMLDTDLKIAEFRIRSNDSYPLFEGNEFALFLDELRTMLAQ